MANVGWLASRLPEGYKTPDRQKSNGTYEFNKVCTGCGYHHQRACCPNCNTSR